MAYCDASYARDFFDMTAISADFYIHHCSFTNNINAFPNVTYHGNLIVDSCRFENNKYAFGRYLSSCCSGIVKNCLFKNNEYGAACDEAYNSTFIGNTVVAVDAYTSLQYCEISGNSLGVVWDGHADTRIMHNNIHDNAVGVQLNRFWDDPGVYFTGNKICNNSLWNVDYLYSNTIHLNGNCWCSIDSATIRSKIQDGFVDVSRGLVFFNAGTSCSAGVTEAPRMVKPLADIKIYPNPFYEQLTIDFGLASDQGYSLVITDQLGRTVRTLNNIITRSIEIDCGNLSAGLYYYQVHNAGTLVKTGKLVAE